MVSFVLESPSTELIVVPLDKQPGFVIVSPTTFSTMESNALADKYYLPVPITYVNHSTVARNYVSLARDIASYHDDQRLFGQITYTLKTGYLVAPLGMTVKSHKSLGKQTIRTIHRGIKPAYDGLSTWLVKVLEPVADSIGWSYKDSFAVKDALAQVTITLDCVLAKVDLKDFFLCGEAEDIAMEVSTLVDDYNSGC